MKTVNRSDCTLFHGRLDNNGYGTLRVDGVTTGAHRLAWTEAFGPIPPGMQVCHHCDVRCCINPAHLWLGDNVQNTADRHAKGRSVRGERHGRAKISEDQARAILTDTRSCREVADEYGIAGNTVSRIRTGKLWTHIAAPA